MGAPGGFPGGLCVLSGSEDGPRGSMYTTIMELGSI